MIRKTINVDVDLSTGELIGELVSKIEHNGVFNATWVFRALSEALTDDALIALRDFVSVDSFQRFADVVAAFSQRVSAVAAMETVDELRAACEWLLNVMANDGGDAWCALRSRPGAKEWVENMKAAVTQTKES